MDHLSELDNQNRQVYKTTRPRKTKITRHMITMALLTSGTGPLQNYFS